MENKKDVLTPTTTAFLKRVAALDANSQEGRHKAAWSALALAFPLQMLSAEAAGAVYDVTHLTCLVLFPSLASESCLTLLTLQVSSFNGAHWLCYKDINFQEMITASLCRPVKS